MKNYFLNATIQALPFENESHPYPHQECLSCSNFIKDPICPKCIFRGFRQWLQIIPKEEETIKEKVNYFLERNKHLEKCSVTCISCNKNSTHTCPYCFTDFLYKVTKEAGAGVRHLTQFLFLFNFDFEHKGYSHDLEAYGGY
ncbi:MAG: hypothetical protein IH845_04265 [Nanoarchaeota archaeon]|nr:hypothetical protein [Nanoarchaeota archaeon]